MRYGIHKISVINSQRKQLQKYHLIYIFRTVLYLWQMFPNFFIQKQVSSDSLLLANWMIITKTNCKVPHPYCYCSLQLRVS